MDAETAYDALERLMREVVPAGMAQADLLSEISRLRLERPGNPPVKGLLHQIKQISSGALFTEEHSRLVKELAFYWV